MSLDWTAMLRPAGGGIYVVSTGTSAQARVQQQLYGTSDADEVKRAWRADLDRIAEAGVVVLGVPTDIGAGYARGASFGPQELRRTLLANPASLYNDPRVIDAGDVLSIPQLLHDEMLSDAQLAASRAALYGADGAGLPVSPLSMAERALDEIRAIAPNAKTLVLGGDHAVGWPSLRAVARGRERETGILHFDAHTDLLETRLGVRYCFATWAYHANDVVGRGGRLAQVGVRISGQAREHWERTLDVQQIWTADVRREGPDAISRRIVERFERAGVRGVYISNDIDGTDPAYAAATGTPQPDGLTPDEVLRVTELVGGAFEVWGSDLVEVAPVLGQHDDGEPERTLATAARYIDAQLALSLR
ncbi:MAG: arginase family protein [Sandaracinaceae bacterium]